MVDRSGQDTREEEHKTIDISRPLIQKLAYRLWQYEANRGFGFVPPKAYIEPAKDCLSATHSIYGRRVDWSNRALNYYRLRYADE